MEMLKKTSTEGSSESAHLPRLLNFQIIIYASVYILRVAVGSICCLESTNRLKSAEANSARQFLDSWKSLDPCKIEAHHLSDLCSSLSTRPTSFCNAPMLSTSPCMLPAWPLRASASLLSHLTACLRLNSAPALSLFLSHSPSARPLMYCP